MRRSSMTFVLASGAIIAAGLMASNPNSNATEPLLPAAASIPLAGPEAGEYDIVVLNGRVMDPESKLDAIRNVGIKNGKITAISQESHGRPADPVSGRKQRPFHAGEQEAMAQYLHDRFRWVAPEDSAGQEANTKTSPF